MYRILVFSGSLRVGSSNTGLAKMAIRLAPAGLDLQWYGDLDKLPYYNGDNAQPHEVPASVQHLRMAVESADGLLFASPEYNHSMSGVLKNAFDWMTRPMDAKRLVGKHITVMTSAGGGGGKAGQAFLHEISGLLGGVVVTEPEIAIAMGMKLISSDGTTTDPAIERLVSARLTNLLASLRERQPVA